MTDSLRALVEPSLRYISLGAGVQSSTLYLLAAEGAFGSLPKAAIFADTMDEPAWVYEQLRWLSLKVRDLIPIYQVSAGRLSDEVIRSIKETPSAFVPIPTYIQGDDGRERQGRRQCTRSHKTEVIARSVRKLAGKQRAELWIGISTDESHRARPSRYPNIQHRWPLLFDIPMRRSDCQEYLKAQGITVKKSSCVYCPFHSDRDWREMKEQAPEEFARAVDFEQRMRALKPSNYLHDSCQPLEEVDFSVPRDQPSLFGNECEGMCGV